MINKIWRNCFLELRQVRCSIRFLQWGIFLFAFSLPVVLLPGMARGVSPGWAAFGSFWIPGLGQALNEDYAAGAAHFATSMVFYNNYARRAEQPDFIQPDNRNDEINKEILTNKTTFEADVFLALAFNTQLYSAYGAYRDGRQALNNEGYNTPAPSDSLAEMALAPFNPDHLFRPTTWVPLILPLLVVGSAPNVEQYLYRSDGSISRREMTQGFAVMHESVAMGEEAFFRGILNNGLSSSFGETTGLISSSAVFGLAHSGAPDKPRQSVPRYLAGISVIYSRETIIASHRAWPFISGGTFWCPSPC